MGTLKFQNKVQFLNFSVPVLFFFRNKLVGLAVISWYLAGIARRPVALSTLHALGMLETDVPGGNVLIK